jgi:hypothetical protein
METGGGLEGEEDPEPEEEAASSPLPALLFRMDEGWWCLPNTRGGEGVPTFLSLPLDGPWGSSTDPSSPFSSSAMTTSSMMHSCEGGDGGAMAGLCCSRVTSEERAGLWCTGAGLPRSAAKLPPLCALFSGARGPLSSGPTLGVTPEQ